MDSSFNNLTRSTDLKYGLEEAFHELADILVNHAGPFASNCVIGSKWRQVNDADESTKDGVKILKHLIVSEEEMDRFAARLSRFVGIAVDARCHDGTTTSMLLFCRLALIALEKMDHGLWDHKRYLWYRELETKLKEGLSFLDRIKITEDDILKRAEEFGLVTTIEDVRAAMAYHMAMISSKGDHDLSHKISQVIRSSPKKIYGMFKDASNPLESSNRYTLKKQEFDLSFRGNPGSATAWNYKNDTQFLAEDAVIFVTGNEIVPGQFESLFLRAFISTKMQQRANLSEFGVKQGWEAFHEGKRQLIIITPMLNDVELATDILEFNQFNPNCKITTFSLQAPHRVRTIFNKTAHYIAGKHRFSDVSTTNALDSFIGLDRRDIKVHCIGSTIEISNLYDKTGEVYHPFYSNPESFEPYTEFAKELEETILFAQDNSTNVGLDPDEVMQITGLYRTLTCQEIYDIEIGGLIHEQYANRTVYEDAMGAALSAINDGVVLGGYGHLSKYFRDKFQAKTPHRNPRVESWFDRLCSWMGTPNPTTDEADVDQSIHLALQSIVVDSTRSYDDLVSDLLSELVDKWSYIVALPDRFEKGYQHVQVRDFDASTMIRFLTREAKGPPILLQAWSGYHEQFQRFADILPKLAATTNFVDMRIKENDDVR